VSSLDTDQVSKSLEGPPQDPVLSIAQLPPRARVPVGRAHHCLLVRGKSLIGVLATKKSNPSLLVRKSPWNSFCPGTSGHDQSSGVQSLSPNYDLPRAWDGVDHPSTLLGYRGVYHDKSLLMYTYSMSIPASE
jgi:hypothetical protein